MGDHPGPERSGRPHLRPEVKWGLGAFVLVLILEYLVLPQLGGFSRSLRLLSRVNVAYLVAGFLLESASLAAYAELTRAVLPPGGPRFGRLMRIDLATHAASHVFPGGTGSGAVLTYRLIGQEGVSGADTGFAIAMQGAGSAVVLNGIFWVALLISLFLRGYNPLYALGAGAGVLLMATFAAVVVSLTRGHRRLVELARRLAGSVPFLDADRLADAVDRFAGRLRTFAAQPSVLRRAVAWAAANWLLDAASLWVCLLAFHSVLSPVYLLVAYGLANILAVIPITPGGLGIIEGVLVPTLVGFGVPNKNVALLAVLTYRVFNFWLPIPVGGLCYLSLRFTGEGWRQRLRHVREGARAVEPPGTDGDHHGDAGPDGDHHGDAGPDGDHGDAGPDGEHGDAGPDDPAAGDGRAAEPPAAGAAGGSEGAVSPRRPPRAHRQPPRHRASP